VASAEEALAVAREIDQRFGEGRALAVLGRALDQDGRRAEARACWEQALGVLEDLGAPDAEDVRAQLERAPTPR
jgi:tetratricopeptide (TPR) repeat protein